MALAFLDNHVGYNTLGLAMAPSGTEPAPVGGFPLPSSRYANETFQSRWVSSMRVYYDDAWGGPGSMGPPDVKGVVPYFHGTGGSAHVSGPIVEELVSRGFIVLSVLRLGIGPVYSPEGSFPTPFVYSYGSSGAPNFAGVLARKTGWVALTLIICAVYGPILWGTVGPIVLLGQSDGSTACVSFGAYGHKVPPVGGNFLVTDTDLMSFVDVRDLLETVLGNPVPLKGMVVNGMTQGGAGVKQWNDMNRNVNSYTALTALNSIKTLMTYGDNDAIATPDYVKHLQSTLPLDSQTAILSAGPRPHNWMNTIDGAPIMADWVQAVMEDSPILDLAGAPATFGPIV